jgi:hypothetical protein
MKNFGIMIFCMALILGGCATSEGYKKIVDSWMGATEEKLIAQWGVPANVYQLNATDKVFTYEESSQGMISGNVVTYSCRTDFTIRDGVVVNWQFKGNKCNA